MDQEEKELPIKRKRGRPRKLTVTESIGNALNVATDMIDSSKSQSLIPMPQLPNTLVTKKSTPATRVKDVQEDYSFSRNQFKYLIEQANVALMNIMMLAQCGEAPGAFDVVTNLIVASSKVTRELLDLQERMKKLDEEENEKKKNNEGRTNNNTAVFVGTSLDILRNIKGTNNRVEDAEIIDGDD